MLMCHDGHNDAESDQQAGQRETQFHPVEKPIDAILHQSVQFGLGRRSCGHCASRSATIQKAGTGEVAAGEAPSVAAFRQAP